MLQGSLHYDGKQPVATALARGEACWRGLTEQAPIVFYAAELEERAIVLGAHQRPRNALRSEPVTSQPRVLRRRSGGAALQVGQGVLYLALGLRERSLLMNCPPLRLLNRNVRGMLQGLRKSGLAVNYFGRDFISVEAAPVGYVGWDLNADGQVLLELFLSVDSLFLLPETLDGYPQREQPALRGREPTTLAACLQRSVEPEELARQIAHAYEHGFDVQLPQQPLDAPRAALARSLADGFAVQWDDPPTLCWSAPIEEAIGFVVAAVALDEQGQLSDLALRGDFFMDRGAEAALRDKLLGRRPGLQSVGAAIDATFAAGTHEIEGVRSLDTLRTAILDATARSESNAAR